MKSSSRIILLSTLLTVTIMFTAILLPLLSIKSTSAWPAPVPTTGITIVRGKNPSYNQDYYAPSPLVKYENSPPSNPPFLAVDNFGSIYGGGVAAMGIAWATKNQGWNIASGSEVNKYPYIPTLVSCVWKWEVHAAKNVLWYEGHNPYYAYRNDGTADTNNFCDNLEAMGYWIATTSAPLDNIWPANITVRTPGAPASLGGLDNFDILFINQMQDPPDWITDSELTVIKTFVKDNHKGLLITDLSDFYNHCQAATQNVVLKKLGVLFRFQNDTFYDDINNPTGTYNYNFEPVVDVDTSTDIGRAYQTATGTDNLSLYCPDTLVYLQPVLFTTTIDPPYRSVVHSAAENTVVTMTVRVTNGGTSTDNYIENVVDNYGWVTTTSGRQDGIVSDNSATFTVSVKVPNTAAYGMQDNITITVTSMDNNLRSENVGGVINVPSVYSGYWIGPPTDDTQVIENHKHESTGMGSQGFMYCGSSSTEFFNERSFMRFDLGQGLPAGYTIENVFLNLYCFTTSGKPGGKNVQIWGLDNDNWTETIQWRENLTLGVGAQPYDNTKVGDNGTLLDTKTILDNKKWYSWNVTNFVKNQRTSGDNIVSFMLKAETENLSGPNDNFSYGFDTKEYNENGKLSIYNHPYLVFGLKPKVVRVTENSGQPGQTVTVDAQIYNGGAVWNSYTVTIENLDENWVTTPTSTDVNNMAPGENRKITITTTVPDNAKLGFWEAFRVTATSKTDGTVKDSLKDNGVFVGYRLIVQNGWNLLGFPVTDENTKPNRLFVGRVYLTDYRFIWWQAPGGPYKTQAEGSVLLDNTGYWVWENLTTQTLYWAGNRPTSRTENLKAGWNLMCFPVDNASTTPHNVFPGLTYLDNYRLIYWRAPGGPYTTQGEFGTLVDNTGYWVWIDRALTITVPA